jgi:NAD(P)-dependent dehydrogenase (short-subunit alcohol dehydrogenase family)
MRSAIITGGAGGLGMAIGQAFLKRGIDVALWDRTQTDAAVEQLSGEGAKIVGVECDITHSRQVVEAWAKTESSLSPVEIVVNCAGIFTPTPIRELSDAQWERTLGVNLTGAFYLCRRAAVAWLPSGVSGAIVNVASNAALNAAPFGAADYGSSKAGMIGLTTHLAVELAPYGIRTNAVCPGQFRSPLNAERLAQPGAEEASVAMIPLGRIGMPEDIATVVVHLALDATYANGAIVTVDGGVTSRM